MKKQLQNKSTEVKPLPRERTEKDADEELHSQQEQLPKEAGNEDLDDLFHRPYKPSPDSINKSKEEDPDDLAHGYQEDEDH